jgi:hypothetical protein
MDSLARLRSAEDWSGAQALRPGQDYTWLKAGAAPLRIAHALGDAGLPTANTLGAMRAAYQAGLRVFEVDLVLEGGELHCQHDPGPQPGIARDGCTFGALLRALPADAWLVLDLKTDFTGTGQQVVERLKAHADARRVVFQLYRPEDFARFNGWQREIALPGPIATAYLAHRRVDHVAFHVARSGVRAFTLPLQRLPALHERPAGMAVLVHPVHDCGALASAGAAQVDGLYTRASLRCGSAPAAGAS